MNGWQIKRVLAVNLFSYSILEVNFPMNSTALVLGQNLDDAGANSNGAGKSSLFDVISWTIWGKTPRSENFASDIIKRGTDHASATVILTDGHRELTIIREKGRKNVLKAFIQSSIEVDTSLKSEDLTLRTQTLTQKAICKFLGYDEKQGFSDYLSQVYFSTMSEKGFLSSEASPAERQQVLERFLGLGVLENARLIAKLDWKKENEVCLALGAKIESLRDIITNSSSSKKLTDELNKIIKEVEDERKIQSQKTELLSKLNKIFSDCTVAKNVLETVSNAFTAVRDKAKAVASEYNRLKQLNNDNIRIRNDWLKVQDEYEELTKFYPASQEELSNAKAAAASIQGSVEAAEREVERFRRIHFQFEEQLRNAKTCPHCDKPLYLSGTEIKEFDKSAVEKESAKALADMGEAAKLAETITRKINELNTQTDELEVAFNKLRTRKAELDRIKAEYDAIDLKAFDKIVEEAKSIGMAYELSKSDHEAAQDNFRKTMNELSESALESIQRNGYQVSTEWTEGGMFEQFLPVTLTHVQSEIDYHEKGILERIKRQGELDAELQAFIAAEKAISTVEIELKARAESRAKILYWTKIYPEIKRKLIDAFVPMFENAVNGYLSDLEIAERVRFSTEVEKRGSAGTKIGFVIEVFDGKYWARFQSYSGGEKSRILVAVGFALRILAVQRSSGTSLGFLLVDELLDNMDATGMYYFFALLKQVEGQKFLITHTKVDEVTVDTDCQVLVTRQGGESSVQVLSCVDG